MGVSRFFGETGDMFLEIARVLGKTLRFDVDLYWLLCTLYLKYRMIRVNEIILGI